MNTPRYREEVTKILASMDAENNQEQDTNTAKPKEEIQDIYVLIVREREEEEEHAQVVDSAPVTSQKTLFLPAYAICCFYVLLIVSTLAFQLYCIFNPPIATVTIIPKSQQVTLSGTLQLGRLLNPITISQSQTVPTTGKGHQDAKQAQGVITFYNGQFIEQTIAAGTILTGADGIQVITDQNAYLPPESQTIPPTLGHITVSAYALVPGTKGNIPTGDINQGCCSPSILAQNTAPFSNGQNERDFQTVAKSDIDATAQPLKTTLAQSMSGAIQGQVQPNEQLYILPCAPTIASDHQPEQEATTKLATGYSLLGAVKVSVTQATIQKQVILSFHAQGTWMYGISQKAQQQIKRMIAGKTRQKAETLLSTLPGVEQMSNLFTGLGDDTRLPKNSTDIHITLFIV